MRIRVAAVLAIITAALAAPAAFQARGVVPLEAADCERLNMMFGDFTVGRAMQHTKVPLSVGMLEVRPPGNGGVQIEKGAGREYSITACVAAGASDKAEAQRLADAVRLVIKGNRVAVENLGQPAKSWNVQLVVEVPDGGSVDAETTNGPIASAACRASSPLAPPTGRLPSRMSTGRSSPVRRMVR